MIGYMDLLFFEIRCLRLHEKWLRKGEMSIAKTLDNLMKMFTAGSYYACPVCRNIEFGKPPDKCPFCGVNAKDFVEVS